MLDLDSACRNIFITALHSIILINQDFTLELSAIFSTGDNLNYWAFLALSSVWNRPLCYWRSNYETWLCGYIWAQTLSIQKMFDKEFSKNIMPLVMITIVLVFHFIDIYQLNWKTHSSTSLRCESKFCMTCNYASPPSQQRTHPNPPPSTNPIN